MYIYIYNYTFGEHAEVDRLAPAVLGRMQTAVDQSYAAHRPRFRIAIFEAAGAGKLGGQGGEQERGIVLGG